MEDEWWHPPTGSGWVDIHKEAEMAAEKICAKNGVCDVSNDKHPWENPVEAQVQGEGMLTKCCNA